jgi:hypothetical protein
MFIIRLGKRESERIHAAVQSGKEVSFLRSDSDIHTTNASTTLTMPRSESERKNEALYLKAFRRGEKRI